MSELKNRLAQIFIIVCLFVLFLEVIPLRKKNHTFGKIERHVNNIYFVSDRPNTYRVISTQAEDFRRRHPSSSHSPAPSNNLGQRLDKTQASRATGAAILDDGVIQHHKQNFTHKIEIIHQHIRLK